MRQRALQPMNRPAAPSTPCPIRMDSIAPTRRCPAPPQACRNRRRRRNQRVSRPARSARAPRRVSKYADASPRSGRRSGSKASVASRRPSRLSETEPTDGRPPASGGGGRPSGCGSSLVCGRAHRVLPFASGQDGWNRSAARRRRDGRHARPIRRLAARLAGERNRAIMAGWSSPIASAPQSALGAGASLPPEPPRAPAIRRTPGSTASSPPRRLRR